MYLPRHEATTPLSDLSPGRPFYREPREKRLRPTLTYLPEHSDSGIFVGC